MKQFGILGLVAALVLLLAACGGSSTSMPDLPKATVTTQPTSTPASEGARLFTSKGCAACHGQDAKGTGAGPGLAGHTAAQVQRQVRAPIGFMPVFQPAAVSNAELAQLADYVEGLQGDHAHIRPVDPGESLAQHHWMTLFALEDGNSEEAVHHIGHIIEEVTGTHLAQMQQARQKAEAGEMHDAAHIIEGMLAGTQSEDLTPSEMQLKLASSAAIVDDAQGALHHLEHVSELMASDSDINSTVAEIQALLEDGHLEEAAHELSELTSAAHEEEHLEEGAHEHD